MITEDYVSFKIAELLKEKGFNAEIDTYYSPEGEFKIWCPNGFKSYLDNKGTETWWWKCIAPSQSMVMKWLREIHLILYIIYPNLESGELRFSWRIYKLEQDKKHYVEELPGIGEYYKDSDELFTTYKDAEESLIKYCLKNII